MSESLPVEYSNNAGYRMYSVSQFSNDKLLLFLIEITVVQCVDSQLTFNIQGTELKDCRDIIIPVQKHLKLLLSL